MNWLEKRLGCSGMGRLKMLAALKSQLAVTTNGEVTETGLDENSLCHFAQQYNLPGIAKLLPQRGDVEDLMIIAWFGSAIADLGCSETGETRNVILLEGALFNLAIALFDTIVDGLPATRPALLQSVSMSLIRGRLWNPQNPATALKSSDPVVQPVAALFDALFVSLGSRINGNSRGRELAEIISLVSSMYNREVSTDRDPFKAKVMTVLFMGRLNYSFRNFSLMEDFYHRLGRFIQLYYDWLDMAEDARHGKPNYFFNHWTASGMLNKPVYYFNFGLRMIGGSWYHKRTARILHRAMKETIEASKFAHPVAYQRNLSLCNKLVIS